MEAILFVKNFKFNDIGHWMFNYAALKEIIPSETKLVCNNKDFVKIFPNIPYKINYDILVKYRENENKYSKIPYENGIILIGNYYDLNYSNKIFNKLENDFRINDYYTKNIFNITHNDYLDNTFIFINKRENEILSDIDTQYFLDAINKNDKDTKYILFVESGLEYIYNAIKKEKINITKIINFNYFNYVYLLDIVRKAKNIVLSNSLTLLWQCYLSYDKKDKIICPKYWFTYEFEKFKNHNIFLKKFILIDNKISDEDTYKKDKIIKNKSFFDKYCISPKLNPLDGIGSNMFTIATAYSLAKKNNCEIIINDTIPFHIDKNDKTLPLTVCDVFPNLLCTKENIIYPYKYYEHFSTNQPDIIEFKAGLEVNGWFRSRKYFEKYREELKKLFDFSPLIKDNAHIIYDNILNKYKNITGIHIRRGDYLKVYFIRPLDIDYYTKCINDMINKKLLENTYLFIFIQDKESEEWFKSSDIYKIICNTDNKIKHEFIMTNQYITIYLMTQCNNLVIANSTFSYMGAFLNKNKNVNVYCPYYWYNTKHTEYPFIKGIEKYIYPENWITIK